MKTTTTTKRKNALIYNDEHGAPFAALISNPDQTPFFVSCGRDQKARRIRYAYALSDSDAQRLGISGLTWAQEAAHAQIAWTNANA